MILTLTLPLPPKGLRPNDRSPWPVKCGLTRTAREQGRRAMFEAAKRIEAEEWIITGYRLHPIYKDQRSVLDQDAVVSSVKAYLDGIADTAHQDDKHFRCGGVTHSFDKENPRMEILLEVEELI